MTSKNLTVTHDGGGLSLVELLLQARDAESNIEKIDCIAGPGKPSTAQDQFRQERSRYVRIVPGQKLCPLGASK
jgi:hypothetical protein